MQKDIVAPGSPGLSLTALSELSETYHITQDTQGIAEMG